SRAGKNSHDEVSGKWTVLQRGYPADKLPGGYFCVFAPLGLRVYNQPRFITAEEDRDDTEARFQRGCRTRLHLSRDGEQKWAGSLPSRPLHRVLAQRRLPGSPPY